MFEHEIKQELEKMRARGMSNSEIAKALTLPNSTVSNILSGYRAVKNTSVDLLVKVFPRCRIDLYGTTASPSGMDRLRQDVEHIQQLNKEAKAAARAEITNRIMSSHLPPDVKVQVWAVINGTSIPSSSPMPPTVAVRAVGTSRPGIAARRAGSARARISALLRENKPGKK